ncbi:unnamed protein product [Sympodiomycopsis kandeliae]
MLGTMGKDSKVRLLYAIVEFLRRGITLVYLIAWQSEVIRSSDAPASGSRDLGFFSASYASSRLKKGNDLSIRLGETPASRQTKENPSEQPIALASVQFFRYARRLSHLFLASVG